MESAVPDDPIPRFGPLFAVFACVSASLTWLWFTSLKPNYILNLVVPVAVLFVGGIGHSVLEEDRKASAASARRRHVPLLRSRYYTFAVLFTGVAMLSILFHVPVHVRFALSRSAMDTFIADFQAFPDDTRPATLHLGAYDIETTPARTKRRGVLSFLMAGDSESGFAYSSTPINGYPGGNPGSGGSLGGGWYWFSDD